MRSESGSAAVYAAVGAVVLIMAASAVMVVMRISPPEPQPRSFHRVVEPSLPAVSVQNTGVSGVPDSSLPPEAPAELTLKNGCLYARLVDPEGNAVKLQVEIKPTEQVFDGTVSAESNWVLGAGFQNLAGALLPDFKGEVKMRVRTVDVHGNCSDWVDLK